jgi:TetR/AcrR family transcriptional regulator
MRRKAQTEPDTTARERLLASAVRLFEQRGYAATTVREIVEAAGVTKPVLYYYFGNKEGIFQDLVRDAMERFDRAMEKADQPGGSARGRIEALCLEVFSLFKEHIPLVRVINSLYYGPPQGAPPIDVDRFHFAFQDRLKKLLLEGRRGGEFRFSKTEDAMWAVIGALNIATEVELCHPEMALGQRDLKRVLAIVFAGLEPKRAVAAGLGASQ